MLLMPYVSALLTRHMTVPRSTSSSAEFPLLRGGAIIRTDVRNGGFHGWGRPRRHVAGPVTAAGRRHHRRRRALALREPHGPSVLRSCRRPRRAVDAERGVGPGHVPFTRGTAR